VRPVPDKVRKIFVTAGGQDLDTLLKAMHAGDEALMLERLHSLKGALFVVGEHEAAQRCAAIELLVEDDGLGVIDGPLAELERSMRDILARHAGHAQN